MRRTLVHRKMGKAMLALLLVQKTPPFSPYPFEQWTCGCTWGKVVELTEKEEGEEQDVDKEHDSD